MDFRKRANLLEPRTEQWRPPLIAASDSAGSKLLARVRRFFDLQAGSIWNDVSSFLPGVRGVLLDVGCGSQPYRSLVSPEARYLGIDTEAGRTHFGYDLPDTLFYSGDVWPVGDRSVDAILCTETMEHVPDTRGFLAQAARCLKPGGMLLLTVPFAARWHFIPYDYWRFTPSSLNLLLTEMGFTDIRVYARGDAVTVACYKVIALILRLLMPQTSNRIEVWLLRLVGIFFIPFFVVLAAIGNLSLMGKGGEDCLGYTVCAKSGMGAA
jgi:SAM-dependent methyltransferase